MEHITTTESFNKARIKLTGLYVGVIFCIVLIFSVFLYTAQNADYRRIVVQQDFGRTVPRRLTLFQRRVIPHQVQQLRTAFIYELILIDSAILLFGAVLSYFFAGKTMYPVNKALANQKNFLADASHELRTPLSAIQTAIEVVLRKEQKNQQVYKETLIDVNDEVGRMKNLIEELLLLSRIDMDQITITHSQVSLTHIAEKTIQEIEPLAKKKKIIIQKNLQDQVSILGDENRIRQLVLILLDNAIKYTQQGGEITVTVGNKPQAQIIVQDTGKGIALENQKNIFKRFYQIDKSHTGSGAGLGLAIAHSIMQLHKGKILVESTIGKGSTFICTFPKGV